MCGIVSLPMLIPSAYIILVILQVHPLHSMFILSQTYIVHVEKTKGNYVNPDPQAPPLCMLHTSPLSLAYLVYIRPGPSLLYVCMRYMYVHMPMCMLKTL